MRDKSPLEDSIVVEHKAPTTHIDEKIERRLSVVVTNGLECLFRYRANDALHVVAKLHVLIIFRGRRKEDRDGERGEWHRDADEGRRNRKAVCAVASLLFNMTRYID